MSNIARVAGQAANTTVKPLDIDDVFSTYLYTGTSSTQTITNGIDLAGEGGLVWMKNRTSSSYSHALQHTTIANGGYLSSNSTSGFQAAANNGISAFNSNGFTFDTGNWEEFNNSSHNYASWTFRKAPKFFDVVTYTGDGVTGREIAHDLGCEVGTIFVKNTNGSSNWYVYNRNLTSANYGLKLNGSDPQAFWGTGSVNSNTFSFDHQNSSGVTYVAYLFAHNDGDGTFGDGSQDIIKCGTYEGSGTGNPPNEITIGFEPQWLLIKNIDDYDNWVIMDTMRGLCVGTGDKQLNPNTSNAESGFNFAEPTATGFNLTTNSGNANQSGKTYIYIAIRRGSLAVPTDATEVFTPVKSINPGDPTFISGFPVDMSIHKDTTGGSTINGSRLTQNRKLSVNSTAGEASGNDEMLYDSNNGFYSPLDYGSPPGAIGSTNFISWMWKRASGFFDVVAYTGTGVAGYTFNHNLGVVPEMIWIKSRGANEYWPVYHKDLNGGTNPSHYFLRLNTTNAETNYDEIWNDTEPTDTQVTLGTQGAVSNPSFVHIAYLFASVAGVSKVGSYTGDGTTDGSKVIDCGFTSGARFILIKRSSGTGNWWVWDTVRGVQVGSDPVLGLNLSTAENQYNWLSPDSSGFKVINPNTNNSGDTYIFYAIA